MKKALLFGGALLAAGLPAAAEASIIITGNETFGNYVGASYRGFVGFGINADFWDESATSGTAIGRTSSNANSISAYANSGNSNLAYSLFFEPISFEVGQDINVTVSWDFSGDEGPGGTYLDSFISLDGPGGNLVFGDLINPVGSAALILSSGVSYSFVGMALAANGISEWSIVKQSVSPPISVPEPSTLALFGAGVGGLIALRRRRKSAQ